MSRISKNDDFHVPFIMNLAFVGLVTIVSMISARYLLLSYLPTMTNTPTMTHTHSQIPIK
jgi:hypothetical protein